MVKITKNNLNTLKIINWILIAFVLFPVFSINYIPDTALNDIIVSIMSWISLACIITVFVSGIILVKKRHLKTGIFFLVFSSIAILIITNLYLQNFIPLCGSNC
jgi:hypothetical protein